MYCPFKLIFSYLPLTRGITGCIVSHFIYRLHCILLQICRFSLVQYRLHSHETLDRSTANIRSNHFKSNHNFQYSVWDTRVKSKGNWILKCVTKYEPIKGVSELSSIPSIRLMTWYLQVARNLLLSSVVWEMVHLPHEIKSHRKSFP
jgi:hypothetical protein